MFTDTHCHLAMMQQREIALADFFKEYYSKDDDGAFLVDIGTEVDDFFERIKLKDIAEQAAGTSSFLYFSAGIWPSKEDVFSSVKVVIISTVVIAVLLGVLDLAFTQVFRMLMK